MSKLGLSRYRLGPIGLIETTTLIVASLGLGCSGATATRTERHVDVFDSGPDGGAAGTGGAAGSEGAHPSDGGREAGPPKTDAATVVDCENSPGCPSEWCETRCCPGPGECAPCCFPKMCQGFDAANCPLERCQLLPSCAGPPICYPLFTGLPPSCGGASYYGAAVPCCSGLVKRCGEIATDGTCDATAGGYQGIPWCLACGDGNCETVFENRCNCPEDCH